LQRLAEVLQHPIVAFFEEGNYSAFQLSDEEVQLVTSFRKIKSADHKNSLLDIVDGLAKAKS
jgi:hypothetical protein